MNTIQKDKNRNLSCFLLNFFLYLKQTISNSGNISDANNSQDSAIFFFFLLQKRFCDPTQPLLRVGWVSGHAVACSPIKSHPEWCIAPRSRRWALRLLQNIYYSALIEEDAGWA